MAQMEQLTDDQVEALLPALAEAARATQASVERFVLARRGIVQEVAAREPQPTPPQTRTTPPTTTLPLHQQRRALLAHTPTRPALPQLRRRTPRPPTHTPPRNRRTPNPRRPPTHRKSRHRPQPDRPQQTD